MTQLPILLALSLGCGDPTTETASTTTTVETAESGHTTETAITMTDESGVTQPDIDADNDGYSASVDCDDNDASLNLDDLDNDGYSTCTADCDDNDASVMPGLTPLWVDSDCDGVLDNNISQSETAITGDYIGRGVANASFPDDTLAVGDFDGDGRTDIAVSAPYKAGPLDTNGIYFFFGKSTSGALTLADADVIFIGEEKASDTGSTLSTGDFDGDGQADLLVTAALFSTPGATVDPVGAVYLLTGSTIASFEGGDPLSINQSPVQYWGTRDDSSAQLYSRARAIGDINGDGLSDLAVTVTDAAGAVTVRIVTATALAKHGASALEEPFAILTDTHQSGDWFAHTILPVGDIDADGLADTFISDPAQGTVSLITGATLANATGPLDLSTSATVLLRTALATDYYGATLSSAGDIDGDGYPDLLIGGTTAGINIIYSTTWITATDDLYDGDVIIGAKGLSSGTKSTKSTTTTTTSTTTEPPTLVIGSAVGLGDMDGDGLSDILVSDGAGTHRLFMAAQIVGQKTLSDSDTTFVSDQPSTRLVAPGDIDGDGHNDILFIVPQSADDGADEGDIHISFNGLRW